MPNGHDYSKEYGEHDYPGAPHHTSDCKHHCHCWAGPSNSGGPVGLDTFGECPGNPKDGKLVGGNADYEIVVHRRIDKLQARAHAAEEKARHMSKAAGTPRVKLERQLQA